MASSIPFTLESVHQEWPNKPILYRIRVPARGVSDSHTSQQIRYLTAPNPPKGASGVPDYRGDLLAFDTVPAGNWNLGRLIVPDDSTQGKFILASTEMAQLEVAVGLLDAGPSWCDRKVDLMELLDALDDERKSGKADDGGGGVSDIAFDIQCMNHLSAAVLPNSTGIATATLGTGPEVIGVWAWQPGHAHGIAGESHIYSIIQARDPGLAPRFLAHITDNGTRIIGFVLERIAGAREAGPADLDKCKDALGRLHALGIAYGGYLRRHSFLVCGGGGEVLLQKLAGAFETTDQEVLGRELERLEEVLDQTPSEMEKLKAPINRKLSDKVVELMGHGLLHPFANWQLLNNKDITLKVEQHRVMVAELAANDYRWTEEDMDRAKQRFGGSADMAVSGAAGESTS